MESVVTAAGEAEEALVYEAEGRCVVCLERSAAAGEAPRLCTACDAVVCIDCFLKFTQTTIEAALYAVPPIRCPSCLSRVRTAVWSGALTRHRGEHAAELLEKYKVNAKHMLGVRCNGCEEFSSLFRTAAATKPEDREAALTRVLKDFNDEQKLEICKLWKQFDDGEINAPAFVRDVMQIVCPDDPPTGDPFRTRTVYNRKAQRFCRRMQNLFTDMERRLSFQVAFMCKYPKFKTPCCRVHSCFLCKINDWHRNETCAESQEKQMVDVQHCPGCGVATLRTEGCSEIVCVCGTTWDWSGEGSEEEWDDEEDEEDEEEDEEEEDEEEDDTETSSDNSHLDDEEKGTSDGSASEGEPEEDLPGTRPAQIRAGSAADSDLSSEEKIPDARAAQNHVEAQPRAKRADSACDETTDSNSNNNTKSKCNDKSDVAQKAEASSSRCIIA